MEDNSKDKQIYRRYFAMGACEGGHFEAEAGRSPL